MFAAKRPAKPISLALAALALACLAAAPARAQQVDPPPGSERWMPVAQTLAERFWRDRGLGHCRDELAGSGLIKVLWWKRGSLGGHMATAPVGACRADTPWAEPFIFVSEFIAKRPWIERCATIVHEVGHLVGLSHDSKFSIMQGHQALPECAKPAKAKRNAKRLRARAKQLRRLARHVKDGWRRRELRRRAGKRLVRAKRFARAADLNRRLHRARWDF